MRSLVTPKIIGTGRAVPTRVVPNTELSKSLGLTESQIERLCGVMTRYWVTPGETTVTLATDAAKAALEAATLSADAIDLIIVSTTSPDMAFPATACRVQQMLGIRPIPAFDISASCCGFLYALSTAGQYIKNCRVRHALVIAAEVKSLFVNKQDPKTGILFGDGAGAVVLSPGGSEWGIELYADGRGHQMIRLPAGGSRLPTSAETLSQDLHVIKMDGKRVFRAAVTKMDRMLSTPRMCPSEVDLYILHQANRRILKALKRIPIEKTHITVQKFGNTSSASLPMALDDAVRAGRLKPGDRLALCAFGGGLTWGMAHMQWQPG